MSGNRPAHGTFPPNSRSTPSAAQDGPEPGASSSNVPVAPTDGPSSQPSAADAENATVQPGTAAQSSMQATVEDAEDSGSAGGNGSAAIGSPPGLAAASQSETDSADSSDPAGSYISSRAVQDMDRRFGTMLRAFIGEHFRIMEENTPAETTGPRPVAPSNSGPSRPAPTTRADAGQVSSIPAAQAGPVESSPVVAPGADRQASSDDGWRRSSRDAGIPPTAAARAAGPGDGQAAPVESSPAVAPDADRQAALPSHTRNRSSSNNDGGPLPDPHPASPARPSTASSDLSSRSEAAPPPPSPAPEEFPECPPVDEWPFTPASRPQHPVQEREYGPAFESEGVEWPCDPDGTIREGYKRRLVEAVRRRCEEPLAGDGRTRWTVADIKDVCADIQCMPPGSRRSFSDLHKQLRELWYLHAANMVRPEGRTEDDPDPMQPVPALPPQAHVTGSRTLVPRGLRDFILSMNPVLLARWRPFTRAHARWNVRSVTGFLHDFSRFMACNNKFQGKDVVLMNAPRAPRWTVSLVALATPNFNSFVQRPGLRIEYPSCASELDTRFASDEEDADEDADEETGEETDGVVDFRIQPAPTSWSPTGMP